MLHLTIPTRASSIGLVTFIVPLLNSRKIDGPEIDSISDITSFMDDSGESITISYPDTREVNEITDALESAGIPFTYSVEPDYDGNSETWSFAGKENSSLVRLYFDEFNGYAVHIDSILPIVKQAFKEFSGEMFMTGSLPGDKALKDLIGRESDPAKVMPDFKSVNQDCAMWDNINARLSPATSMEPS